MRRNSRSGPLSILPVIFLVLATLLSGGCGRLRIHQPRDLQTARQAQASFKAAGLGQTIEAERRRLDEVLEQELRLVREHTLARRDARLLYIIGEGDPKPATQDEPGKQGAWEFLKDDIDRRISELGFDEASFQMALRKLAQIPVRLSALETRARMWNTERANWNLVRQEKPQLPKVGCPRTEEQQRKDKDLLARLMSAASPEQRTRLVLAELFYDDYLRSCKLYLAATDVPLVNHDVIEKMKSARREAENAVKESRRAFDEASRKFAQAVGSDEEETRRREFLKTFEAVGGGAAQVGAKMSEAVEALRPIGLEGVVADLSAKGTIEKLELERGGVLAMLGAKGDAASKTMEALAKMSAAFEESNRPPPVSALLIQEEQLRLDIQAAQKRAAFFDEVLDLLIEQEEAYRTEIVHLGAAERHRRELAATRCLQPVEADDDPKVLERLFATTSVAQEECREIVFRLLVAYSNAWTLGRVKVEEIDYQLIALHHQAALDSSEIAFAKWQSLLGLPIDQLVALHESGLRRETIITTIVNALGLGAIAAGVN